jgi:Transposase
MAKKRKKDGNKANNAVLPVMRPDAAGIDIGATEIFVAVPADRAAENVRAFRTFTQDLYAAAEWLKQCGIKTVAMESTGVYWIPLFQILEARDFEVCLVNARHVKNVPGRRTDVSDCQCCSSCTRSDYFERLIGPSRKYVQCGLCCATGKAWCKWPRLTSTICRRPWTR